MNLPDRVLVYGVTGSGKTTAALAIGSRTGLPVTLVDELTWLPGWVPVEASVQRDVIGDIVAGERWVLDSSYGDWLGFVIADAVAAGGTIVDHSNAPGLTVITDQDGNRGVLCVDMSAARKD